MPCGREAPSVTRFDTAGHPARNAIAKRRTGATEALRDGAGEPGRQYAPRPSVSSIRVPHGSVTNATPSFSASAYR